MAHRQNVITIGRQGLLDYFPDEDGRRLTRSQTSAVRPPPPPPTPPPAPPVVEPVDDDDFQPVILRQKLRAHQPAAVKTEPNVDSGGPSAVDGEYIKQSADVRVKLDEATAPGKQVVIEYPAAKEDGCGDVADAASIGSPFKTDERNVLVGEADMENLHADNAVSSPSASAKAARKRKVDEDGSSLVTLSDTDAVVSEPPATLQSGASTTPPPAADGAPLSKRQWRKSGPGHTQHRKQQRKLAKQRALDKQAGVLRQPGP